MNNEYIFARTPEEEFEALNIIHQQNFNDFGSRLLRYPSAMTFYTNKKNRYNNILPKEDTRVRLSLLPGIEGSDYINANRLTDGFTNYISCQAPLSSTFGDFWRMVWEQDVSVIVMLTKIQENGQTKADKYWPSDIGEVFTFPFVSVTLINVYRSDQSADIDIRVFSLKTSEENERIVVQLHFLGWPDFGVPEDSEGIRQLVNLTNFYRKYGKSLNLDGPIVVHCSAGVGRSGAFIAIHQLLDQYNEFSALPQLAVYNAVNLMRTQRDGMVQTKEQYSFIYKVIQDEIEYLERESLPHPPTLCDITINTTVDLEESLSSLPVSIKVK